MKEYALAYENKPGDYYPIDLRSVLKDDPFFSISENQPITLERIDYYTAHYENETELKERLRAKDALPNNELCKKLVILFHDGKMRTLEDGILYDSEEDAIDDQAIISYVLDNLQNSNTLNRIYTKFMRPGSISCAFERFLEIIHAPKTVSNYDIINAINSISGFSYLERRRLGLFIHRVLINKQTQTVQNENIQNPLRLELSE